MLPAENWNSERNSHPRRGVSLFDLLLFVFKSLDLFAEFHPKVAAVGHEICYRTCKRGFVGVPWTNLAILGGSLRRAPQTGFAGLDSEGGL